MCKFHYSNFKKFIRVVQNYMSQSFNNQLIEIQLVWIIYLVLISLNHANRVSTHWAIVVTNPGQSLHRHSHGTGRRATDWRPVWWGHLSRRKSSLTGKAVILTGNQSSLSRQVHTRLEADVFSGIVYFEIEHILKLSTHNYVQLEDF